MKQSEFKIDFIGLGAPKCGTTTLARWLDEHPEISLYPKKEINYFCTERRITEESKDRYAMSGIEGYNKLFENKVDFNKKVGEFSVLYIYSNLAAERIKKHFPDIKLIIALREPVSRLYSQYNMDKNLFQDFDMEFKEAIKKYPQYIENCKYSQYLETYFNLFPRENIKVILLDDIKDNPEKAAQELFSFLGVKKDFQPPSLKKVINPAQAAKSKTVTKILGYLTNTARKLDKTAFSFLPKLGRKIGVVKIMDFINEKNRKKATINPLSKDTKKSLYKIFKEDIDKCEKILDRNLDCWRQNSNNSK